MFNISSYGYYTIVLLTFDGVMLECIDTNSRLAVKSCSKHAVFSFFSTWAFSSQANISDKLFITLSVSF